MEENIVWNLPDGSQEIGTVTRRDEHWLYVTFQPSGRTIRFGAVPSPIDPEEPDNAQV